MLEGLPPNNAAHVMRLRCDEASARAVADLIVESFDPAETAAAAFEEQALASWDSGPWIVEAYFADAPDEAIVRELVAIVAGEDVAAAAIFDRVSQRDWVASSLEGLAPVRVGRFLIHGAHGREAARAHEVSLEIEAALAFGTGHHGTTRGCLALFESVLRRRRPRRILDVGSGTGVLALAAARVLRQPIAAGDIDPVAVAAAQANARLNRAGLICAPSSRAGLCIRDCAAARPMTSSSRTSWRSRCATWRARSARWPAPTRS